PAHPEALSGIAAAMPNVIRGNAGDPHDLVEDGGEITGHAEDETRDRLRCVEQRVENRPRVGDLERAFAPRSNRECRCGDLNQSFMSRHDCRTHALIRRWHATTEGIAWMAEADSTRGARAYFPRRPRRATPDRGRRTSSTSTGCVP